MPKEEIYPNIREVIGEFIGATVVDITQGETAEELSEGNVYLHFSNGKMLIFHTKTFGFEICD